MRRYEAVHRHDPGLLADVHGLRIDHVMGLFRQFWMPEGCPPTEGAYVTYPADELLAIVCLEASARRLRRRRGPRHRRASECAESARCRVTSPAHACCGSRTQPPDEWPENSLATVTTHDLPTIAGVWTEADGDDEQRGRLSAGRTRRLDRCGDRARARRAAALARPPSAAVARRSVRRRRTTEPSRHDRPAELASPAAASGRRNRTFRRWRTVGRAEPIDAR